METEKKNVAVTGTAVLNLYQVSFEDNLKPSENGLGFITSVAATNEQVARYLFNEAEPDCTILSIEEAVDRVIAPLMSREEELPEMTLNEYQEQAMTTCMESSRNVEYMMLNLIGEVGELAEKLLPFAKDYAIRNALNDATLYGKYAGATAKAIRKGEYKVFEAMEPEMWNDVEDGIIGELGDVLWQLAGLCEVLGLRLNTIGDLNLLKLSKRKKAGTIDGNGDGVDGKERTV